MRELSVESLTVRGFRNLASVDLRLGSGLNVISGGNGQGKTSLLEAIYVVATTRSFRTARAAELVVHGGEGAHVAADIAAEGLRRRQTVGIRNGIRDPRIEGKRLGSMATYATKTPAVVFHPGSLTLVAGAGAERRALLDRIAIHESPASLGDREAYTKAVRARQRVLEMRSEQAPDLDHWEELVVKHGLAVVAARKRALASLEPLVGRAHADVSDGGSPMSVSYRCTAPHEPSAYLETLRANRRLDRIRGSTSIGAHRDDLQIELNGRLARGLASQGQQRTIAIAFALAEVGALRDLSQLEPILLLDDVSSELDGHRTDALFRTLREKGGQVFVTTTRPEMIEDVAAPGGCERRFFDVLDGRVRAR